MRSHNISNYCRDIIISCISVCAQGSVAKKILHSIQLQQNTSYHYVEDLQYIKL